MENWRQLRETLKNVDIKEQCIQIDCWWQRAPLVTHYLHPDYISEWPGPWDLLHINNYCEYARALGMIYTLLMLGIKDIALYEAKDDNDNEVVLVVVSDAKYVLNYWPNTVVNNSILNFTITRTLDIAPLFSKIG